MCRVLIGGSDTYFYENIFKYVINDFLRQTCHIRTKNCKCSKKIEMKYCADLGGCVEAFNFYNPDLIIFDENFQLLATEKQQSAISRQKDKIIQIGYCQKDIYNKDELFRVFFKNLQKRPYPKDTALHKPT